MYLHQSINTVCFTSRIVKTRKVAGLWKVIAGQKTAKKIHCSAWNSIISLPSVFHDNNQIYHRSSSRSYTQFCLFCVQLFALNKKIKGKTAIKIYLSHFFFIYTNKDFMDRQRSSGIYMNNIVMLKLYY